MIGLFLDAISDPRVFVLGFAIPIGGLLTGMAMMLYVLRDTPTTARTFSVETKPVRWNVTIGKAFRAFIALAFGLQLLVQTTWYMYLYHAANNCDQAAIGIDGIATKCAVIKIAGMPPEIPTALVLLCMFGVFWLLLWTVNA